MAGEKNKNKTMNNQKDVLESLHTAAKLATKLFYQKCWQKGTDLFFLLNNRKSEQDVEPTVYLYKSPRRISVSVLLLILEGMKDAASYFPFIVPSAMLSQKGSL